VQFLQSVMGVQIMNVKEIIKEIISIRDYRLVYDSTY